MIKKILVFIILFIIFYEIYLLYTNKNSKYNLVLPKSKIEKINTTDNEQVINPTNNNNISKINLQEETVDNDTDEEPLEYVNPNMYGKPIAFEDNKFIVWENYEPKPWSKIVYKYGDKYPFYFFIKIKIPSLNDYQSWKKIITNIDFDPKSGEVIIPTTDEETALSIANLMINNLRGEISLEEIIKKNLILISINKAKKYDVVKNKIKEQVISSITPIKFKSNDIELPQNHDISIKSKNNEFNLGTYEGIEYSSF